MYWSTLTQESPCCQWSGKWQLKFNIITKIFDTIMISSSEKQNKNKCKFTLLSMPIIITSYLICVCYRLEKERRCVTNISLSHASLWIYSLFLIIKPSYPRARNLKWYLQGWINIDCNRASRHHCCGDTCQLSAMGTFELSIHWHCVNEVLPSHVIPRSIFSEILINDTQQLVRKGNPWGCLSTVQNIFLFAVLYEIILC